MICIAENSGGKGGVAGGAGSKGQASQSAMGTGVSDYGYPVIEMTTGMTCKATVQLTKDTNGEIPADLSQIARVDFIAKPAMAFESATIRKRSCDFDEDTGQVVLELGPCELNDHNGVWYAEFLGYDEEDRLVQSYRCYLCIRKGMTGSHTPDTITAMDVRMALMDTSVEANQLLDDLEFSDTLIYHAIERCINEWNETPPAIATIYSAVTFPFKEHLIQGAVGYLMQQIAYRYTRNRMMYQAGGLSLDTSDKGPSYIQLAQQARAEWKNFISAKKTELSMYECFGTVSMPYFDDRGWV